MITPDKPFLSEQSIIEYLKLYYGIETVQLHTLLHGADLDAVAYKAESINQISYFVKIRRNIQQDSNSTIIEFLLTAGLESVVPLIRTIQGYPSQRMGNFVLNVYPFVEGQNGFERTLTETQWYALGTSMKQIHGMVVPSSIQAMIRRENYSPKWRQAVRALCAHIKSKPAGDEITLRFWDFMQQHIDTIQSLVERADHLSQSLQNQSLDFVLCHSDIHAGNVLIDHKDNLYIVDWDAPIMAPKERDLMFIGGGVANIWNKPQEEEWFYKGYGKAEINRKVLAYYRHERIVEDIALYGQQLLFTHTNTNEQERIESYHHFIAQFDPNGVVEIAFQTDRV